MINLDKEAALKQIDERTDIFKKAMEEADLKKGIIAKVVFVEDISGSMINQYNDDTMQGLTEMIFPVALNLDDDGELEMFVFENNVRQLESLNKDNFFGYVKDNVTPLVGGGTNYAPVIKKIINNYTDSKGLIFKTRTSPKIPTFVIFQTDGANDDEHETDNTLKEASKFNIFFKFITTGNGTFGYLNSLKNKGFNNCDVLSVKDIKNLDANILYERLLQGFKEFLDSFN